MVGAGFYYPLREGLEGTEKTPRLDDAELVARLDNRRPGGARAHRRDGAARPDLADDGQAGLAHGGPKPARNPRRRGPCHRATSRTGDPHDANDPSGRAAPCPGHRPRGLLIDRLGRNAPPPTAAPDRSGAVRGGPVCRRRRRHRQPRRLDPRQDPRRRHREDPVRLRAGRSGRRQVGLQRRLRHQLAAADLGRRADPRDGPRRRGLHPDRPRRRHQAGRLLRPPRLLLQGRHRAQPDQRPGRRRQVVRGRRRRQRRSAPRPPRRPAPPHPPRPVARRSTSRTTPSARSSSAATRA